MILLLLWFTAIMVCPLYCEISIMISCLIRVFLGFYVLVFEMRIWVKGIWDVIVQALKKRIFLQFIKLTSPNEATNPLQANG